ncbi:deoxyguanosinetriphosphate triphosphohydrolase [Dongia rigui]|uniref:Deoxyguanosinetriphosphate triphosphohydrolase-like protein n=1 Tax=Dongia rigui TaxID=940149 RepID=A0ABU5DSB1_9PROT|nr:deoxyguanosinetriphosphate triphosphohydrolase [Dongia rigui]MDY0870300.1 deoxyguanosinetriphosphate triphosphohydrolase [Dongia rigui]
MSSAPFACHPEETRGRRMPEAESPMRSVYQRDRDRVVHSAAFRRLKHKTQVFVYHEGDHYRTRLTHSLEVAQIARTIARVLGLNEDLAEALALAHDLGHPPFGHAGEDALNACMADLGGFDHNEQTFRVLTSLERRYAGFDGLNLTWEMLEGIVKHNGPLRGPHAGARNLAHGVPATIAAFDRDWSLELDGFASAEAQVAALSDDIAYNNHDIDDGLRAGLFAIEDLNDVPLAGPVFAEVAALYPGLEPTRLIHEAVRRMINVMVSDVITESQKRLAAAAPKSVADIRSRTEPVIAFSAAVREHDVGLKRFLFQRMYRHERINRTMTQAKRVVTDLFACHLEQPYLLPSEWSREAAVADRRGRGRVVADYIAGMTDKFALECHDRLFGTSALVAEKS